MNLTTSQNGWKNYLGMALALGFALSLSIPARAADRVEIQGVPASRIIEALVAGGVPEVGSNSDFRMYQAKQIVCVKTLDPRNGRTTKMACEIESVRRDGRSKVYKLNKARSMELFNALASAGAAVDEDGSRAAIEIQDFEGYSMSAGYEFDIVQFTDLNQ